MQSSRRIALKAGIAGGLLFTIHVSIPYCGSWPFMWPALAGITAVWLATREPQAHRWRDGFVVALLTGVMTGVVAFIGVAAVIYTVLHTGIASQLQNNGVSGPGIPAVIASPITVGAGARLGPLAPDVAAGARATRPRSQSG